MSKADNIKFSVYVDPKLFAWWAAYLMDPVKGKPKKGEWSATVEKLLREEARRLGAKL